MLKLFFLMAFCASAAADSPQSEAGLAMDWGEAPTVSTVPYRTIKLRKGDTLYKLFKQDWKLVARFNQIDERHLIGGRTLKVPRKLEMLKNWTPLPKEYLSAKNRSKYILVILEEQFLGAYENGKLIFDMPISSGRPKEKCDAPNGDCSTPVGKFRILGGDWDHISSLYDDPDGNPYPMPWAIRFYVSKSGIQYWIHGGDLPDYPASHGCIRVTKKDALKLFRWLFPKALKKEFWIPKNSRQTKIEIQ